MSASLPFGVSARGASILVVDDEPDVADLFRQSFRREARQGTYVMLFAVSGAEALDRLAKEIEPTLIAVLSDINMPGMDGLELLGEIKQRRPDLPVMMVTAYGDDDRRRRARELGASEFITKPVDFDPLCQFPMPLSEERSIRSNDRLPVSFDRSSGPGKGRRWGTKTRSCDQGRTAGVRSFSRPSPRLHGNENDASTSRSAAVMMNAAFLRQQQPLVSAGNPGAESRGSAFSRATISSASVHSSTCSEMLSASSTSIPR